MPNTPQRAEFWKDFICTKSQFPVPEKLRAQFAAAELSEFCNCGCNSFKVQPRGGVPLAPIAKRGGYGAIYEVNFHLTNEDKTLEIILFAGEDGNLAYVEINCCGNAFPVPETISIEEPPFHVYASDTLAL